MFGAKTCERKEGKTLFLAHILVRIKNKQVKRNVIKNLQFMQVFSQILGKLESFEPVISRQT